MTIVVMAKVVGATVAMEARTITAAVVMVSAKTKILPEVQTTRVDVVEVTPQLTL
jgi:hypothetical protein